MITGYFDGNVPMFNIIVGSGPQARSPFVILDTGFTGDLQITPELAKELDLSVLGVQKMGLADGSTVSIPSAYAFVELEGVKKNVQVLISESMSLVGISLLSRFQYKAVVDCKYKTVELQKV